MTIEAGPPLAVRVSEARAGRLRRRRGIRETRREARASPLHASSAGQTTSETSRPGTTTVLRSSLPSTYACTRSEASASASKPSSVIVAATRSLSRTLPDPALLVHDEVEIAVQVNGKVRDRLRVAATIEDDELLALALASERVQAYVDGKELRKTVIVPGRLVSLVVSIRDGGGREGRGFSLSPGFRASRGVARRAFTR